MRALVKSQRAKISLMHASFSMNIISFPSMLIVFFHHVYLHFVRKSSCRSAGVLLYCDIIKKSLNKQKHSLINFVVSTLTWSEYHVVLVWTKCKQKQNNMHQLLFKFLSYELHQSPFKFLSYELHQSPFKFLSYELH